ncbi:MAG: hypothetical protein Q9170_005124 [Blastenia crenularia]
MSNCIARAKKEVFIATNYWKASDASTLIANSLRELSRRAGLRGNKAIVKVMYDRGSAKQVFDNHQIVPEPEYTGKDNDNLEMMTHLEGLIVDSVYDMALISWSKALKPPLPCSMNPAAQSTLGDMHPLTNGKYASAPCQSETLQHDMESMTYLSRQSPNHTIHDMFQSLAGQVGDPHTEDLPEHTEKDPHYDPDIATEVQRSLRVLKPRGSERKIDAITRHLSKILPIWGLFISSLTEYQTRPSNQRLREMHQM